MVVWDNASRDRSAAAAGEAMPGAEIVWSEENLGFAAAVNRCAALRPGADLLLVNPDVEVEPGTVAALREVLEQDPAVAVVGAAIRSPDGTEMPSAWRFPAPWRTVLGSVAGLGRAYAPISRPRARVTRLRGSFVPFTAALLRREVFDRLGGLDEGFWLYGEDADYCYRSVAAGGAIAIAAGAVAVHRGGASSGSVPDLAARSFHRGGDRFRAKHFSPWSSRVARTSLLAGAGARVAADRLARRLGRPRPDHEEEWLSVLRHYSGR